MKRKITVFFGWICFFYCLEFSVAGYKYVRKDGVNKYYPFVPRNLWHSDYCIVTLLLLSNKENKQKKPILITVQNFVKLPNRKFPLRKQIKHQIILLPNIWLMKRHLLCLSSLFLLTGIHILYFKLSFHMVTWTSNGNCSYKALPLLEV